MGLAASFTGQLAWGYLELGMLLAVTTLVFVALAPEQRAAHVQPVERAGAAC